MEVCLSISTKEPKRWLQLAGSESFVELRADLMGIVPNELTEVIGRAQRAIVTCHSAATEHRKEIYQRAIAAGAWAVDIDFYAPTTLRTQITEEARRAGVKVIFSHHFATTPTIEELTALAEEMFACGCDIAKIITQATTTAQALIPLGLYERFEARQVVAFAMGEAGAFTRRLSLLRGAPYTYAAPSAEERTAVGQPTAEELRRSLSAGESLEHYALPHSATPPTSKSEAQRAIVLATLASGTTTVENYTPCGDTIAAEGLAVALGAKVSHLTATTLRIEGVGAHALRQTVHQSLPQLEVGESALLARMTLPLVALLLGRGKIKGSGTLLHRSLAGDMELIGRYGAECKSDNGKLPAQILSGAKVPQQITIDCSRSSQSVTGWMVALGAIGGTFTLEVANPTSRPYIALTAQMMEQFGASVGLVECEDRMTITITSSGYRRTKVSLAPDWSGAAYFATAYAITQSGLKVAECYTLQATTNTKQADEAIIDILRSAGAVVEIAEGEVRFLPSEGLRAFAYNATHTPDLIPTLAVLALFCKGSSRIGGLHRLANKESNRTEAIVECLVALGARVRIEGDELMIEGSGELHPAPLRSHSDHRIAMAMATASLFMAQKPTIDNLGCVAKSYPDFFEQLNEK